MSVDAAQFCLCKNPINFLMSMNNSARRCVFCTVSKIKQDKLDFRTFVWKRTSNSYNITSFYILKYKSVAENTWIQQKSAEVTMTLSVINSNNDFDFVGWVITTLCVFYFRRVKCHYVKETHMMLVAFWRWWKLLQHLSTKDIERSLGIRAHLWYGTIFLFLEQIAPSWRHISPQIHAHVGGSRVDVVTLRDQMVRVERPWEIILRIFHSDGRE